MAFLFAWHRICIGYLDRKEDAVAGRILIVARVETKDMFPRKIMESSQHSIEFSENVDQLFQLLAQKDYDLLFLELDRLASSEQEDFYRTIKDKNPGMKIILITSAPGGRKVKEAMDAGVYGCVQKPFQEKEIVTMVRQGLIP